MEKREYIKPQMTVYEIEATKLLSDSAYVNFNDDPTSEFD